MPINHPALLQVENEKLRGLLREAYEAGYLDGQSNPNGYSDKAERDECVDDLLSQQAEPATAQDEQYPPCDFCGVIPDHHPWHGSGMFKGFDSPHIHACNDCRHLLPSRPAQTEQQPVGWFTDDHLTDKSATTYDREVAERWRNKGWPVNELFTAPIAQTAQGDKP